MDSSVKDIPCSEQDTEQILDATVEPKKRRRSGRRASSIRPLANHPNITGSDLRRELTKFDSRPIPAAYSSKEYTLPLLDTLQLPILMVLNKASSMQDMRQWFLAQSNGISEHMPQGALLSSVAEQQPDDDIFARILSGVYVDCFETLLWQCRQWQQRFVYSSNCDGYKADLLKLDLTQDASERLSQIEQLYRMTITDKAVIWMETPDDNLSIFLPISLGNLLQAFDPRGMILKINLSQISASSLARLFSCGCHIMLELSEANKELYDLSINGLSKNEPQRYISERHGLELSLVPSASLDNPMHRARLASTGWICEVKQSDKKLIYLLWWHKDIKDNLEAVAEACHYLAGSGPRWYWTDDAQDYFRVAMPSREQRLGRNLILLNSLTKKVLSRALSYKAFYKQLSQDTAPTNREKLQNCLGSVPAASSCLMHYLLGRFNPI